jgi:hypothetical protein
MLRPHSDVVALSFNRNEYKRIKMLEPFHRA